MPHIFKLSLLALSLSSLSLLSSTDAFAQESPHEVGLQIDISEIDTARGENTEQLNDVNTLHYTLSYQYNINGYFAVGVGYLNGDSNSITSFSDIFTDSKLDYSAVMLSAKAKYPISKRNSLYVQVNALQYDYDIIDDGHTVYNDDGGDIGFSIGWQHQYDMGLGLKVGYDILNFGDDITINGVSVQASYHF